MEAAGMVGVVKAIVTKKTTRRKDYRAKQIGMEEDVFKGAVKDTIPTSSTSSVRNMAIMQIIVTPKNVIIVAEWVHYARDCRAKEKVEETINLALDDATSGDILFMSQNEEPNTKGDGGAKDEGGSREIVEVR